MKSLSQNLFLTIAIAISVLAHGILLAVHFTAPEAFKFKPADPGLEVILVNAKHNKKPLKADALAQANLDGGGNAEKGRSKSPLPDMQKTEDGEAVKAAQRRVVEMEQQERKLMEQMAKKTPFVVPRLTDVEKTREVAQDGSEQETAKALARQEAELHKRMEDENKRPKKTYLSPSTMEVGYAMYYDTVRRRIENIGTMNFPQKDGKKLYGELTISIPIFQDGTIYDKDGGPSIDRSSGNPALDAAALKIARRAAPFGRFPPNMRSSGKDDVWVVVTRFKFTREEALEAETSGR